MSFDIKFSLKVTLCQSIILCHYVMLCYVVIEKQEAIKFSARTGGRGEALLEHLWSIKNFIGNTIKLYLMQWDNIKVEVEGGKTGYKKCFCSVFFVVIVVKNMWQTKIAVSSLGFHSLVVICGSETFQ